MLDRLSTQSFTPQPRTVNSEGINHYNQSNIETIKTNVQSQNKAESAIKTDEQVVSKEQVKEVVDSLNQFLQPSHTSLHFAYHEKLNEYYVEVVDTETDETIREIPSKKLMDSYATMLEFVGIMVDKKI